MQISKLDRRFNGYGQFTYCLTFRYNEDQKFHDVREWCWDTWGASSELEILSKINLPKPTWCWSNIQYNTRIYIKGDKELNWYKLRWGT